MGICLLFFLLMFLTDLGVAQDQCKQLRCGNSGPAIRFPFRLKDRHPNGCGFPGFELSCRGKSTVLELPLPVKFYVKSIDYTSQVIQLYDPDDCLLGQLLKINGLSVSPLGFLNDLRDYTLFNCSVLDRYTWSGQIFPCLGGGSGDQVLVVPSDTAIEAVPLAGCTKMNSISSVPFVIYDTDIKHLYLNWTRPNCSLCEAMGNGCRLKSNATEDETECFAYPKSSKGNNLLCFSGFRVA